MNRGPVVLSVCCFSIQDIGIMSWKFGIFWLEMLLKDPFKACLWEPCRWLGVGMIYRWGLGRWHWNRDLYDDLWEWDDYDLSGWVGRDWNRDLYDWGVGVGEWLWSIRVGGVRASEYVDLCCSVLCYHYTPPPLNEVERGVYWNEIVRLYPQLKGGYTWMRLSVCTHNPR